MKIYKYTAAGAGGKTVKGVIGANSESEAMALLREEHSAVLSVSMIRNESKKEGLLNMDIGGKKLNGKAFVLMCSEFSTILSAGLPIARAVILIAEKTSDKHLKRLLNQVAQDVDSGISLSDSFEEHGKDILPPTFVDTLRAGEESGNLSKSFRSIYSYFNQQAKVKGKVKKAMAYPVFVMVIAVVVVFILMVRVVPTLLSIFAEQGNELPFITRLLISMSEGTKTFFPIFLLVFLGILFGTGLWKKTERGRMHLASLRLMLPVLGHIEKLNAASQFANTMATMVSAGLPLTKAVQATSQVISNAKIRKKVEGIVQKVEQGHPISEAMREIEELPDILTDLVAVGEDTGEIQGTLDTVAKYYDQELDVAVSSAVSAIEPVMLVFLAGFVGFIVIAIYMSMFTMYQGL